MRGYLLIFTSGILFFIIAVVTVLHLMSAKSLNQQYQLNSIYQDILNRQSIKSFIAFLIDKNSQTFQLPLELSNNYQLTNQLKLDGSYDFTINNLTTSRISTFNISEIQTQSSRSAFDPSTISIAGSNLSGVHITSPTATNLVALRTVWYPYNVQDTLINYSFVDTDGNSTTVTPNAFMGEEYQLSMPLTATDRYLNLNFSALPMSGAISIYLKYSDGSIQNAHIEF